MGLAPSKLLDFPMFSVGCEVPVPIFSQPPREKSCVFSFSGYESRPATVVPAGSSRSEEGGNELAPASTQKHTYEHSADARTGQCAAPQPAAAPSAQMP